MQKNKEKALNKAIEKKEAKINKLNRDLADKER